MASIRLCKDAKVARLILREGGIEGLEKLPHDWRSCLSGVNAVVSTAIGEASANRLVNINHVGVVVETVCVVDRRGIKSTEVEFTRSVLLESSDH